MATGVNAARKGQRALHWKRAHLEQLANRSASNRESDHAASAKPPTSTSSWASADCPLTDITPLAAAQTLAADTRPSAFLLLSNSPDRNLESVSKFCPRNSSNVDPRPHLSLLHFTLWKVCVFTPSFGAKPQKFKRDAFALPSLARPLSPSLSPPTSRAFCSVGTAARTRGAGRLARGRRAASQLRNDQRSKPWVKRPNDWSRN